MLGQIPHSHLLLSVRWWGSFPANRDNGSVSNIRFAVSPELPPREVSEVGRHEVNTTRVSETQNSLFTYMFPFITPHVRSLGFNTRGRAWETIVSTCMQFGLQKCPRMVQPGAAGNGRLIHQHSICPLSTYNGERKKGVTVVQQAVAHLARACACARTKLSPARLLPFFIAAQVTEASRIMEGRSPPNMDGRHPWREGHFYWLGDKQLSIRSQLRTSCAVLLLDSDAVLPVLSP